ncbi:MAG: dihydroflavonol 4-reductase [Spirochaetales bacterium]|nr:dihydroflavonol 4-reductase [Spirochaetales bacterium]
MADRVLVTGGDGFLGSNIVRELLDQEYLVRVFAEPGRDSITLSGLQIERSAGDIRRLSDLEAASAGCDYIIHAAASTSLWPTRSGVLKEINVDGTRNVIQSALAANVKKMVYVGSANTFGFGPIDRPGDESSPYMSGKYGLDYMDTKHEAQGLVIDAVKRDGLSATVVAPTFMFGPYDAKPGSGLVIIAIAGGRVPGYSPGGRCYIHVRDAARGAVNALVDGAVGESYILGNENLTYKELFRKIATVCGVSPPKIPFPSSVTKTVGFFGSLYGNIFGVEPRISLPLSRLVSEESYYTPEKAVRELSLPQTPIITAIEDALRWLNDNRYMDGTSK